MMQGLNNLNRRESEKAMSQRALVRMGIVSSYDPNRYAAKVTIQPEGFETGFLPVATPWVGSGWGMFCPPTPGDVVDVHFQEGGKLAAYVSLRFYGNAAPPLNVPSGEFWLVHQSGTCVKMTNDGKMTINGHLEIDATAPTINITAASTVNVTAPAINLGSVGQTLQKLVTSAMQALFNSHTHPAPGGTTGTPNQTMGASHVTTVTSAG
ncbi:phage baseplate assembly protein V [Limnoglobus roseus]|uniref:Gp5/Type VI secretion system Vgr protein OB-fold domain-containing protein n=1 Tax=Limnoglobus roseus TaxID=2598579 RepID=A0A5C1AH11_9BACT|nr:phage baseplate assembly protein V [Limnoglobus roseus]QEL18709.1 hypothetical protein PX52LOC_05745 [Limnoglobus roseus]